MTTVRSAPAGSPPISTESESATGRSRRTPGSCCWTKTRSSRWPSPIRCLRALRELRVTLSELRLEKLQVGPDGRNRVMLSPFGASSGRNTPPSTGFIFGPSTWLRSLIKPAEGRALAYIDWSSEEVWIAAYLSNDPGDAGRGRVRVTRTCRLRAGRAGTAGRTKQSHPDIRSRCKAVVLGVNYGMRRAHASQPYRAFGVEAQHLITRMERTFPVYTEWVQQVIGAGIMRGSLSTCFGWTGSPRPIGPLRSETGRYSAPVPRCCGWRAT